MASPIENNQSPLFSVSEQGQAVGPASTSTAEREIALKKTIHLSGLCNFAKYKSNDENASNFMQISPYLTNLTELDLSNWDFNNKAFLKLHTLSRLRLLSITSLNFTSTQNLTLEKLKSLLVRLPSFNGYNVGPKVLNPQVFPNLNYFNFTGSNYKLISGELINDYNLFRNGRGTIVFSNGNKYEGGWLRGDFHGQGTFTYLDGSKYEGAWQGGEGHGQGTYTHPDGSKYEGAFQEGKPHGLGTETYADGAKYEGEWQEGKRHGRGTSTLSDGAKYEGAWIQGIYQG